MNFVRAQVLTQLRVGFLAGELAFLATFAFGLAFDFTFALTLVLTFALTFVFAFMGLRLSDFVFADFVFFFALAIGLLDCKNERL